MYCGSYTKNPTTHTTKMCRKSSLKAQYVVAGGTSKLTSDFQPVARVDDSDSGIPPPPKDEVSVSCAWSDA